MRVVALGIALVLCGCKSHVDWTTKDSEQAGVLVREYYEPDYPTVPTWVLRVDMSKAHPTSYVPHWQDSALDLDVTTAKGVVHDHLFCYPLRHSFSCGSQKFDYAFGSTITVKLDEDGEVDHYTQSN